MADPTQKYSHHGPASIIGRLSCRAKYQHIQILLDFICAEQDNVIF